MRFAKVFLGSAERATFISVAAIGVAAGICTAFVGGRKQWIGDHSLPIMIVFSVFLIAFFSSWILRRRLVGPVAADIEGQIPAWALSSALLLFSAVFGVSVVGLLLLVLLIIGLSVDWRVTELAPAFVSVTFFAIGLRALLGTTVNLGLIAGSQRREGAESGHI